MMVGSDINVENNPQHAQNRQLARSRWDWVWRVCLVIVLLTGGYLRLVGMRWDDDEYLHPDERFLTFVVSSIHENENASDYFDTAVSTMNPHNVGYTFYVYGTLPLFITYSAAEAVGITGWDMYLVGRYVSAGVDILTILLAYLIGIALFKKQSIGVLAAAFYTYSVLPIQLSHYFTVDIQANFFSMAALYCAVLVMNQPAFSTGKEKTSEELVENKPSSVGVDWLTKHWRQFLPYLFFGITFGMAMACKISVLPIAGLLVLAGIIRYFRLSSADRDHEFVFIVRHILLAGILSIVVFRICQPYAFTGPGFLGFIPNKSWIDSLKSLSGQSKGLVDFPPALQWSRRPLSFGFQNLTIWGLGLPLGILAWAGFVWMFIQMLRGKWNEYLFIWGWTAVYFAWQSVNFTSSMRYFLQIYLAMGMIAAWCVVELWQQRTKLRWNWYKILSAVLGVGVVLATAAWGFAFSRIYTRPVTRVEASDWYYQNIEGAVNLKIKTSEGERQQILPDQAGRIVTTWTPLVYQFQPMQSGTISSIQFDHVVEETYSAPVLRGLKAVISTDPESIEIIGFGELFTEFGWQDDTRGNMAQVVLAQGAVLTEGVPYYLVITPSTEDTTLRLTGSIALEYPDSETGLRRWQYLPEALQPITEQQPKTIFFTAGWSGELTAITFPHIGDLSGGAGEKYLHVVVKDQQDHSLMATGTIQSDFLPVSDIRGEYYRIDFDQPMMIETGRSYTAEFVFQGEGGVVLNGNQPVDETGWDDNVPLRRQGYDPFSQNDGVFRSDLSFEMYWDDNQDKRERFLRNLEEADVITITSNRQWGTTTRVPERYPMTTMYYRELLGCPEDKDILWCYAVAEPGMFDGSLGFTLTAVFQSNPNLGSFEINDQLAEEAFTVYDHPKVLIFTKDETYDADSVYEKFMEVDLSQVIHMIPAEVPMKPAGLMLPIVRFADQQNGGTWSGLFNAQSLMNQYPIVALVIWYVAILLMGWVVYPITRLAFSGLADHGYGISRLVGLLLLAWLCWLTGSAAIPVTKLTVWLVFVFICIVSVLLAYRHRIEIIDEIQEKKQLFITIELVSLVLFVFFVLVRLGNPDLWHPYKGGEKPMDFAYWNAVIKSITFPPYNPWFSGGYINYYYYGFVVAGMPVKALGIQPSIAYNLVLPTFFSLVGLGAFSIGYTIQKIVGNATATSEDSDKKRFIAWNPAVWGGLVASMLVLVIGNLGTVKMIFGGLTRLGATVDLAAAGLFTRIGAFFTGIARLFGGNSLPFYPGDWYWIPSRTIPNEPITEFPYFTFLYADLHAHLLALPITILVILWCVSVLNGKWMRENQFQWGHFAASIGIAGLAIGALRPTNTWDFPTYLILGLVVMGYTLIRYLPVGFSGRLPKLNLQLRRWILIGFSLGMLVLLAVVLYTPFNEWFAQGYTSIRYWDGEHTPVGSYLTHWGIFLAILLFWLGYETYQWMESTPLSSLNKLAPYRLAFMLGAGLLMLLLLLLLVTGVRIAWIALPMAVWAGVLIFRKGQPDLKRLMLFLVGTGMVLTLAVELVALQGDIGRMNTVFKLYMQAWSMLSISSAMALCWIVPAILRNSANSIAVGARIVLGVLLFSGLLFPMMATYDKITDRMEKEAPHTLDGMAFMQYAEYNDQGNVFSLDEDYRAIRWMQDNVVGTPVIIEGNVTEYRWGNRFSIYTGLPSVVGWNWHQRQQRTEPSVNWVQIRVDDINTFYNTSDPAAVELILNRYDVSYIIVGKMEHANYSEEGLQKFPLWEGQLWTAVYSEGQTTIYKVIE